MSNRRIGVPFNPQKLLNWMKENGYSNRKLAKMLNRDECTIRRYLKTGEMPQEVMDRLYLFVVNMNVMNMNVMNQIMNNEHNSYNARLQELKEQYLTAKYAYLNYKRRIENHEV